MVARLIFFQLTVNSVSCPFTFALLIFNFCILITLSVERAALSGAGNVM